MKRRFWFLILFVLLLSACAPQSAPQSTSPTEELSESRETAPPPSEQSAALSRARVRQVLIERAFGSTAPPIPEVEPQRAADYRSLEGKVLSETILRFGLPYDADDSLHFVRYLSQEGHDVILRLSAGTMEKSNKILGVSVNTRDQAKATVEKHYPELSLREDVFVLREGAFQYGAYAEKKQTLTTVKAWVEAYGLPFSLPAEEGFQWYYLTNNGGTLNLYVNEENGELILRDWELNLRKDFEKPSEKGLLPQEKTAAFLSELFLYFPYEPLPVAAPAERYRQMLTTPTTLDGMLEQFGAPYDLPGKDPKGKFSCRYFSDGGDDVQVTLAYDRGIYSVIEVRIFSREVTAALLNIEAPSAPSLVKAEDLSLGSQLSNAEILELYGPPYFSHYTRPDYQEGNYVGYYLLEDGTVHTASLSPTDTEGSYSLRLY